MEVRKDRKYMLQFPETMSTDEQTSYLEKIEKSLKSEDRFTVIDSKIKLYEAEKVTDAVPAETPKAVPDETPTTPTDTPAATPAPTETPAADPAPVVTPDPAPAQPGTPVNGGVKVEKVEVGTKAEAKPVIAFPAA